MTYNTVVSGTTITATWGNQVRDQQVSVFASVAARDSAITVPVNGMYATTTDTGWLWRYNGSKWLREPTTVLKTGDTSWTSTTTLSDDPDLQFLVDANATYEFSIDIGALTVSNSVGLKVALTFPASARADYGRQGWVSTAWFNDWQGNPASGLTGTFSNTGSSAFIQIYGSLSTVGSSGSLKVQAAQGTSSASSVWILRGSRIRYRQTA
jgi:hypothetical protein